MDHEWVLKFVTYYIQDPNILGLIRKYLKVGVLEDGDSFLVVYADDYLAGFEYRSEAGRYLKEM
ncbi:hypothetical protein INP51_14475 [Blautia liquoris]|jgi:hypothetical protein|uniref:Uncharacterized protein n=1 Tax=Blautia liquoris TaxID=2779518 RepID=A0A7M2RFL7_9FIRM|nr:hypothetical protein [Blautia liquoris]QOV19136.1 hypothetical protein INP51_14475 [Blautia liquoris]